MPTILDAKTLPFKLKSPLTDPVVIDKIKVIEQVGELFEVVVHFHCPTMDVDLKSLIGKDATLSFEFQSGKRHFSGIIGEISQGVTIKDGASQRAYYTLKIYPKLWILTFSKEHRIFQNKSAMDIIKDVLKENGVTDISDKTTSSGKDKRDYCVQYNETNYDFVRRLMWEEGIFYFFTHTDGGHSLVLCDDISTIQKDITQDVEMVNMSTSTDLMERVQEIYVNEFVVPKKFSARDFNFEKPQTILSTMIPGEGEGGEVYSYPGLFMAMDKADGVGKLRIQELEWTASTVQGKSTHPLFLSGTKFKLSKHIKNDFNQEYVLFKVEHHFYQKASQETYSPTALPSTDPFYYENSFMAFKAGTPFRMPQHQDKPRIYGNQTAIVTGKEGEEIWCDEYRRVKVKFHWDRSPDKDEKTSCWIRVAQVWSGSEWGGLFTPRIGMEVVVTFLDGDPDRPLIIGCVYNGANKPPYDNNKATQSTIKSNSSKEDKGFNEIRFEDKKGEEEFYLHAQKDMNIDIINSQSITLEEGSRSIQIQAKKGEEGNDTLNMTKGDKTIQIDEGNMKLTLSKGNLEISITGDVKVTTTGDMKFESKGEIDMKADNGFKFTTEKTFNIKADGEAEVKAPTIKMGSNVVIG